MAVVAAAVEVAGTAATQTAEATAEATAEGTAGEEAGATGAASRLHTARAAGIRAGTTVCTAFTFPARSDTFVLYAHKSDLNCQLSCSLMTLL